MRSIHFIYRHITVQPKVFFIDPWINSVLQNAISLWFGSNFSSRKSLRHVMMISEQMEKKKWKWKHQGGHRTRVSTPIIRVSTPQHRPQGWCWGRSHANEPMPFLQCSRVSKRDTHTMNQGLRLTKAECYLHKDSAISVSMGINSPCSSLATDGTSKSHQHPSPRGFCEERPRESGNVPRFIIPTNCRNRGTFHPRTCGPSSTHRSTQHQSHRSILTPQIIIRI